MELKILESSAKRAVFQIIGADHTLCNALKKELVETEGVTIATYAIEHPEVGIPKLLIETSKGKPKDAIVTALATLEKKNKTFMKHFKAALK
ncbi:MAG: RpoL/Rpb11 RNA polymerase subunit family protein [Nanobdellota archaeon]